MPPPSNTPDSSIHSISCSSPTSITSNASKSANGVTLSLSNAVSNNKKVESKEDTNCTNPFLYNNNETNSDNTITYAATNPFANDITNDNLNNKTEATNTNGDSTNKIKDKVIQLMTGMGSRFKQQILEIEARKKGEGKRLIGGNSQQKPLLSEHDEINNAPTVIDLSNDRSVTENTPRKVPYTQYCIFVSIPAFPNFFWRFHLLFI